MVLAAAAVLVPLYCDYAARVALAESLRQLAPYRDAVAENVSKEGSVEGSGVDGAIPSEVFLGLKVDYARVFPDGTNRNSSCQAPSGSDMGAVND